MKDWRYSINRGSLVMAAVGCPLCQEQEGKEPQWDARQTAAIFQAWDMADADKKGKLGE
jgi:hypothetical protein